MDDGTKGWMEKASRKTTATSFTICNVKYEIKLDIRGQVSMSSRGALYVTLQKYSFASKFGYLLFCNPTHEEAETANRW
jgi:hypothetical protein